MHRIEGQRPYYRSIYARGTICTDMRALAYIICAMHVFTVAGKHAY